MEVLCFQLLSVTSAGAGRVNQQEDTTFRYLAQPDGDYRISVKAEAETSHRSIEESSHVVMPRRWTVDDRGVLVAVSTNTDESEVVIKVEKPDLTSETEPKDCANDIVHITNTSEAIIKTPTIDASGRPEPKMTVGDTVNFVDSMTVCDNSTIGDDKTVGGSVTIYDKVIVVDKVTFSYNIGVPKYKCTMCGKAFPRSGMATVGTDITPSVCVACNKSYARMSIVVHRRTLPWGKPFQCSHCGELLASTDTLRVHERQHTWAEGYTCGVCGREFTQLRGLKCHSRTHAGKEKTHQCNRCGKTFRRRSYLKSHEERQNCNGPFTCVSCGKIFRYSGSLFMHTRERKCSAMAM